MYLVEPADNVRKCYKKQSHQNARLAAGQDYRNYYERGQWRPYLFNQYKIQHKNSKHAPYCNNKAQALFNMDGHQ
ncbi:iron transporter [bacterium]|nr:iron transporter [bacterium]